MRRTTGLALGASLLAAVVVSATATAAGPATERLSFVEDYVDTQTCPGIPIDTRLEGRVTVQVFSATRVQVHQHLVFSGTANGKSFTDNESYTEFANPATGVSKFAGTTVNIQIPGYGRLLADTGTLTVDFSTDPWTVVREGGKHPLFYDGYGALCAYLSS